MLFGFIVKMLRGCFSNPWGHYASCKADDDGDSKTLAGCEVVDAIFSEFNLDSEEVVPIPPVKVFSTHLQLGFDPTKDSLTVGNLVQIMLLRWWQMPKR